MYKRYGLLGCIRLICSICYTKLVFPKSRLIRLPFDIRNKHLIKIGNDFTSGFNCRVEAHPVQDKKNICIEIGDNVQINDYVHIAAGEKVSIGDNTLIASRVFISDLNHGSYRGIIQDNPLTAPNDRVLHTSPVLIDKNVWIGENVCVMPGVSIGEGSVIGASAVVTKNIPAYSIAVGNPAKVIKVFNFEEKQWLAI